MPISNVRRSFGGGTWRTTGAHAVRIVEQLAAQTETERIEMTLLEDLMGDSRIVLLRRCLYPRFVTRRWHLAEMSAGMAKKEMLR